MGVSQKLSDLGRIVDTNPQYGGVRLWYLDIETVFLLMQSVYKAAIKWNNNKNMRRS